MFRRRRSENYHHHRTSPALGVFNFMRKPAFQIGIVIIAVVVVLLLAVSGQQTVSTPTPDTANLAAPISTNLPAGIDVSQAYAFYKNNAVYILDVRDRQEWDQSHIPGTTLLPLVQVAALADKMPQDKPIIVVSSGDDRSVQARDIIRKAGILNVTSMTGGIAAWKQAGFPIEP